ncbi:AAEL015180-PA, partial [Aedes aegypti]
MIRCDEILGVLTGYEEGKQESLKDVIQHFKNFVLHTTKQQKEMREREIALEEKRMKEAEENIERKKRLEKLLINLNDQIKFNQERIDRESEINPEKVDTGKGSFEPNGKNDQVLKSSKEEDITIAEQQSFEESSSESPVEVFRKNKSVESKGRRKKKEGKKEKSNRRSLSTKSNKKRHRKVSFSSISTSSGTTSSSQTTSSSEDTSEDTSESSSSTSRSAERRRKRHKKERKARQNENNWNMFQKPSESSNRPKTHQLNEISASNNSKSKPTFSQPENTRTFFKSKPKSKTDNEHSKQEEQKNEKGERNERKENPIEGSSKGTLKALAEKYVRPPILP